MKILLLILGIVSFSPLAQQRPTPANENSSSADLLWDLEIARVFLEKK